MIGSSDGKAYEDGMDHLMDQPVQIAAKDLDKRTPEPLPILPPVHSIAPHNPNPPGGGYEIKPGERLSSDDTPEAESNIKLAMEDRRQGILSDATPLGGRIRGGEGGAGGKTPPAIELKLESKGSGTENYKLHAEGKPVGDLNISPVMHGDKKFLYVGWTSGEAPGATVAQRVQAATKFKEAVKELHPDAVGIYGLRISGAKAGKNDPLQVVPLKDEYSSKDLRAIINNRYPQSVEQTPSVLRTNPLSRYADPLEQVPMEPAHNPPAIQNANQALQRLRSSIRDEATESALRYIERALRLNQ